MAGRGFGKTLAGAHWITAAIAATAPPGYLRPPPGPPPLLIALVGATLAEARRVMVEGRSGLLAVAADWVRAWHPSLNRLVFRTGAEAHLFSGASPEQLRGPEHHFAWCDELAKWEKGEETWDMLQLGLRLGALPRALVTTTPRAGGLLERIMAAPDTIITGGPTSANPHTSAAWKRAVHAAYAGTRLAAQELEGKLLPNLPGALWTVELLASCRAQGRDCAAIARQRVEPASVGQPAARSGDRTDVTDSLRDGPSRSPFLRIVIGVDPPTGDGTCGIIVCAKDAANRAHVLADHSVAARSPEGWSSAVADAARIWSHPRPFRGEGRLAEGERGEGEVEGQCAAIPILIVAEQNQGGRMVRAILHTADPALRVKPVTATLGKAQRAAPVAMLFEAGKVTLHGRFPELEAELLGMIAGGDYAGPGGPRKSPDRADAMVWALTELMLAKERGMPRVVGL